MAEESKVPWQGASPGYAGWLPNVRSHLSFSMIGASRRAEAYTRAYKQAPKSEAKDASIAGPKRLVLALERRVSNDYPWFTPIVAHFRRDLVHYWLLDAETRKTGVPTKNLDGRVESEADRQGMLVGSVHVMPYGQVRADDTPDHDAEKQQLGVLASIELKLANAPFDPTNHQLDTLRSEILELAGSTNGRVEIRFALMRTGEVRLWYAEGALETLGTEAAGLIAEQAYFFLKDIVHDHTHHEPSSDQITPLVRTDIKDEEDHSGEIAWRRETLWSLSREIERLNRDGSLVSFRRSLGVIAYADAFQQALMGHIRKKNNPATFEMVPEVHRYDFGHLKDSIKASIDVAAAKKAQTIQLTVAFIATFLSAVSVVGSMVSAQNGSLSRLGGELGDGKILLQSGQILIWLFALNPFATGTIAALLMLGAVSLWLTDGRAGIFNPFQRVLSQSFRAASVSISASPQWQLFWDRTLHWVAIMATLACTVGLMRFVNFALQG